MYVCVQAPRPTLHQSPTMPIEYLSAYEDKHGYRNIQVPPTSSIPFTPLQPAPSPDAKCKVFIVKNSVLNMALSVFVRTSDTKAPIRLPVYTFVIEVSNCTMRLIRARLRTPVSKEGVSCYQPCWFAATPH